LCRGVWQRVVNCDNKLKKLCMQIQGIISPIRASIPFSILTCSRENPVKTLLFSSCAGYA